MMEKTVQERVTTLACHYDNTFGNEIEDLERMVNADWESHMAGVPFEIFLAATSWWLSRHNPEHGRVPMPEDILARAGVIMRGKGVV